MAERQMTFCVNFAEISLLCAICGQQTDDIIPPASAIGGGEIFPMHLTNIDNKPCCWYVSPCRLLL